MTALATTWTEQTVVEFNAGTLADIAACITHVGGKLQRGTLGASSTPTSTQISNELVRAKEELCEVFGFTWQRKYSYADTVAAQYRYALPKDYAGEPRLRDTTSNRFLEFYDNFRYDLKYPDMSEETANEPPGFTVKDRELWLINPPAGVYRLELEYNRSGDDSTATDITYLPELMRFKICVFASYQGFLILHEYEKAQIFREEWMEGLLKSKRQSGKQKWASSGYQALTWQQAYVAGYHQ